MTTEVPSHATQLPPAPVVDDFDRWALCGDRLAGARRPPALPARRAHEPADADSVLRAGPRLVRVRPATAAVVDAAQVADQTAGPSLFERVRRGDATAARPRPRLAAAHRGARQCAPAA
jgi:hypothetical protein